MVVGFALLCKFGILDAISIEDRNLDVLFEGVGVGEKIHNLVRQISERAGLLGIEELGQCQRKSDQVSKLHCEFSGLNGVFSTEQVGGAFLAFQEVHLGVVGDLSIPNNIGIVKANAKA